LEFLLSLGVFIMASIEGVKATLTEEAAEELGYPELVGKEVRCKLKQTDSGLRACDIYYYGDDTTQGYSGMLLGTLRYPKIFLE
jgi:hypothetical protein